MLPTMLNKTNEGIVALPHAEPVDAPKEDELNGARLQVCAQPLPRCSAPSLANEILLPLHR